MLAALSRLMYGASRPSRRGSLSSNPTIRSPAHSPVVTRTVRTVPPPCFLLRRGSRKPDTAHSSASLSKQLALLPVSANGPVRDAQSLCNLGLGQAAEVAQLDDLGQARIERGELVERLMDGEDLFRAAGCARRRAPSSARRAAAPPPRRSAVRRRAKSTMTDRITRPAQRRKCTRSSRFKAPDAAKRKYDSCTSEPVSSSVSRPPGQPHPCQLAEVGVRRGEQPVSRVGIAFLGAMNQIGQVDRIVHGR